MKLNFKFCRVAQSQPQLQLVMPQDDLLGPTAHPPKPGLGYLCPSPGQVPKKSFSPQDDGRQRWRAGGLVQAGGRHHFLFYLCCCCVSESEPSNASTWHQPGRRDSAFFGLFRRENPARQRAPPILRSKVLGTKNVLKKIVPQRGQSTRRGQIIQA